MKTRLNNKFIFLLSSRLSPEVNSKYSYQPKVISVHAYFHENLRMWITGKKIPGTLVSRNTHVGIIDLDNC